MLAKSCQWWLIWYLLFFCHGGAEGQLQWVVKEKVTAYGQNLILFCPVENCCSEPAGWSVGHKSIILDVKAFSNDPSVKYHGTYNTYGFGVVIRNLSEADLNVTYRCAYGFDQSTPKHLLHGDVFKESTDEEMEDLYNTDNQTENEQDVPDKDKENDTTTAIVVAIVVTVVVIALIIIGIVAYCVCRSRIKKKRQKQTGTNEKMEVVYNSNNQMENQRDEVEGQSVTDPLLPTTPVDSNPRQSSECIEVEIIQKGPISVGHGGTIRINAKIISNSTGSLKVNWQKTHDNCSTALSINCLKYSGSSCNVNNPELVINNFNKDDAGIYKLEVTSTTETKSSPGILLELFGDEADSLSKKGSNFFRLYILCQKIATQAVRDFFDSNVPGLKSFLKQHKSDLTSKNSVYRCTKEQKAILFPGNQVAVDSADFDLTLLYKLIRNLLTTIPAPISGWGHPPLPQHINEADDIERIRDLRDKLAHNSEFEICDTDFSTHWTDLSQAINRLSKDSLSTNVELMRTKKFDNCTKNEMKEDIRKELKEIQADIADNKQNIADIKQDIADNKQEIHNINTSHIPQNIKKGHAAVINKWKEMDELFYDKTRGFTATLKMVEDERYRWMTIIGGPGCGKTATAHHIALHLEKKEWEVVPVCELKDIIKYGDRDQKQVFVLDDVLGIFAVEMDHIIKHRENIVTAIGKTSKLLFTCRKSVYNEAFKFGLFVTENVVDLQSKDNQLTKTERMSIFQCHCKAKGVNSDLYTSLSFINSIPMFPLLCKLFLMEEKYQQLEESFFNKPFKYFISELDKLLASNTIQYAVLVLCLVNEGKLSVELLPHESKQEVFNNCGVNLGTPDKQIIDAIYHMSETYFTKLDTEYTFTHDFIFEAIAYHYGRQNQEQILKYLPSSYIANKVTVYKQDSNEDLYIHISEDMYLPLAERLYADIHSMNLFDVFMNKSLQHGPFLKVFIGMLKAKPFDKFESLILRKHKNIRHLMQKTLSFDKRIETPHIFTEHMNLYILCDWVYRDESEPDYIVRVISWIINYGHTDLLREIVNHVKDKEHSISLIFGSDVMENTRLLVLGCFSNNIDMVKLILEYVDLERIDLTYGASSNFHGLYTPLMAACAKDNLCIVDALLSNKTEVNKCNYIKESPLLLAIAIAHGHVDVVRYLLNSGADVNLCDVDGQLPLFIASLLGHCDIVQYLVDHNADVNLGDVDKQSPLSVASKEGHCDIVKYLVDHNADVNLGDVDKQSPLSIASKEGHCDIVEYLVDHNADVNLCDVDGQSPLLIASLLGQYDIVMHLVDHNADVNLFDVDGQSPLYIASQEGHCAIVKYLVAHNADVNLCDLSGQSPLSIALQEGHCDIFKYLQLVAHNADVNLTD